MPSNQTCYNPTGIDRNLEFNGSAAYLPCGPLLGSNRTDKQSMCCRTNLTESPEICRDDGLCYNHGSNLLWRESCTDPTWRDRGCLKLCLQESGGGDMVISVCENGSYCCGKWEEGARECCVKRKGVWIINGVVVSNATTPMVSTSTETYYGGGSSSENEHIGSEIGSIAGATLGGISGVALICGGTWWALRKRRQKRKGTSSASNNRNRAQYEADGENTVNEVDGRCRGTELDASREVAELI